jgi:Na+-transporting NADH:ubiquinone oxidoreductase subunit B
MFGLLKRLLVGDGDRPSPGGDLPTGRDMQRYLVAAFAGALPCLVLAVHYFGVRVLAMVLVAFVAGVAVELAFSVVRKRPISGGAVVQAILLALILPSITPLWMVALASAFGTLFGKEVFGGTGHHVFSPVLVAKGLLVFSYPTIVKGSYVGSMLASNNPDAWVVCSAVILLGAVAMIIARPSNLQSLAGVAFGGVCVAHVLQTAGHLPYGSILELLVADGFLFGACFLVCDPACSPRNRAGKLLYGMLIGLVAVLMRSFSNYSEAMMAAILVGNLCAPLIDAMSVIGADGEDA